MVEQSPARITPRLSRAVAVSLLILGLSACADSSDPAGTGAAGQPGTDSTGATAGQQPTLPAGWRWESYGGVQVGVPGEWGWGNGAQRLTQWCAAGENKTKEPVVGRPGATTLVGCSLGDSKTPRPETLIANTGFVVSFDRSKDRAESVQHEGDRTTVQLNGVSVVVQAPAELREQIAATVHPVDIDAYGCPATHAISDKPQLRPAKPVDAAALKTVTTVSACKYRVGRDAFESDPRLISSVRLDGASATAAIQKIGKAPGGGGPNHPEQCAPSVSYGDEIMVLRAQSSAGPAEIFVRYAGCDHNGFDDGTSVRKLTPDAVTPLITGSNGVAGFSGAAELLPIFQRDQAGK